MMVQFDVKRVQKGTESFMVSFDYAKTPITQIADYIIISASKHNASDIHFDPREDGMMVRFRIDGDCQDYTFVPKAYERNLTTRLKLLANMNITESRLPQDGAIKGTFGDTYLDMRVSSLPLNEGEKIVIRILDYTRSLQGIDSLGFHPKNLEKVKRMMGIPNGIILTTGATGSGKSTTTYSILQGLNKPETNVITVEDPIEMNIEGINQVQVNAEIGMTFAAALRSILRQDPNVILIGEIRDSETAQIAVRASITGHLVLSTIHTNNALATVERLLDMDVERYLLSTALSGIISQRLAKMLCQDCKYQRETTKYEKKVFKKYMNMDVSHVWDANPKGCDNCRRGYHGRIAVHEVLELTDDIRAAISNEKLEKKDLAKMVYDGGTITMLQDALIKCLEGKTSFEEVYRTIEIENEDDDNYENEMASEIKESVPVEEVVTESDGLLDVSVKKDDENDVSKLVNAPAFTAADFADAPEATEENAEGDEAGEKKDEAHTEEKKDDEKKDEEKKEPEVKEEKAEEKEEEVKPQNDESMEEQQPTIEPIMVEQPKIEPVPTPAPATPATPPLQTIPALATDVPNTTPAVTPTPTPAPNPAPVPQQPSIQNVARPMPTIAPVTRVDQPMIPQIVANNTPLQQPAVTAAPSLANIIANPSPVGQKVEQVQTFKSVVNQPIPEIVSDVVQKVEPIKPLEDDTLSLVTPIPTETVNAMPPTNVSDVPKIEMEKDLVPLVPEV